MFSCRLIRLLCAAILLAVTAFGDEENYWPFYVHRDAEGTTAASTQYLGPLIFAQSGPGATHGVRPLFQESTTDGVVQGNALYPLFTWRREADYGSFSFIELINSKTDRENAARPDGRFDIWPLYFSRTAADPAESYRALFPLGGTIKHRFAKDRISFVLFPLYAQTQRNGRQITHAPWPFLSFIQGAGYHGFEFWPLFGRSTHDGDYDDQFYLWPLGYKSIAHLSAETPDVKIGALPFYARDTGPGYISETYGWPFFGYTHRTAPYHFDEQRYFWPLLVQARGDDRMVNRWAPLYTHSVIKGTDKTWLLWPLYRNQRWSADGVAQEKVQVLYFFWWSLTQHSLANPAAAPAHKTHLWPLFSAWDNGAGRRQVQALSPFEVFFPNNETVRQLWSPLFALYRYERDADASTRTSLLWNAVTWRQTPLAREFHLGPLFSVQTDASRHRVAFGNGVFGWQRLAGEGRRFFLFDFRPKAAKLQASQDSPP